MKSNVLCGYYFNGVDDTHSLYNGKEYIGGALIIQQKLLKKHPKHSSVIKEMFMHNQAFLLDSENNYLYLPKNNYKLTFEGVIDVENFNAVKLTGIGLNDIKALYAYNYINQDTKNSFAYSITESISLSPDGEKLLDEIAEEMLTKIDK